MSSEDHFPPSATASARPFTLPARPAAERDPNGFTIFTHGHKDMVQAVAFNMYGDRLATGSVDGQIKIFNKRNDGQWDLLETWTAHHSEVLEIHWLPPTLHPNILGSIGIDGRFRLWAEDVTIAPNSGRRFSSFRETLGCFTELRAPPRMPFLSMAMRHNADNRHTYLALLNRDGLLKLWINEEPEDLRNWNELDEVRVCARPERGEETSFKVRFDPNLDPSYNAIMQGVPADALGLVVASMDRATLWRTKEVTQTSALGLENDVTKELYLAAEIPGHRALIRDVAWAPNSIRGFDIIATACKDGYLRIFEVHTPPPAAEGEPSGKDGDTSTSTSTTNMTTLSPQKSHEQPLGRDHRPSSTNAPSGIGAGLAKTYSGGGGTVPSTSSTAADSTAAAGRTTAVPHVVREVARLGDHRSSVWKVAWDADGQLLGSTGDDGRLWLWRRRPDGSWANSAQLAVDTRGLTGGAAGGAAGGTAHPSAAYASGPLASAQSGLGVSSGSGSAPLVSMS